VDAREEEGAKEQDAAKEKEMATAKIEADAREPAAAALEVLPARAAARVRRPTVGRRMATDGAEKGEEAEEVAAKQEAAEEAAVREAESAQEVDEPNVLPDGFWSAGCAAYRVQCMLHVQCMCSACLWVYATTMLPHLGTPRAAGCVVICRPKRWPSGSRAAARSTHARRAAAR
jgi:hypothetical protein